MLHLKREATGITDDRQRREKSFFLTEHLQPFSLGKSVYLNVAQIGSIFHSLYSTFTMIEIHSSGYPVCFKTALLLNFRLFCIKEKNANYVTSCLEDADQFQKGSTEQKVVLLNLQG